jgi:peptidoglycan/LPS O-acetylase OafA/YrhL
VGKRSDIQVLRGVAVLLVLAYHSFPTIAPRGFLGVDIFFVISGFLMTRMIVGGVDRGDFTFVGFYLRRARRLLPAAFVTFAVTAACSWWIMTPEQWSALTKQLVGAVTFTANFAARAQGGYFDGAEQTKPLLHVWSLSLEEQFYFVLPFVLWIAPAKRRLAYLAVLAALSLAWCFMLAGGTPSMRDDAFYFLQSRAWELLAGSVAATMMIRSPELRVPQFAKIAALLIAICVALTGFDDTHPRWDALATVLATAVLLLGRDGWLPATAVSRAIARIGDWSYSLYLVHWPLIAFAWILYAGAPPAFILAGVVVASIGLAALQYRWVEEPWRRPEQYKSGVRWAALIAAPAVMACAPATVRQSATAAEPVAGLSPVCDQRGGRPWFDLPECRTSDKPEIAVWGDSYAMALVPGVREAAGRRGLVQMTRSACAPIQGVAMNSFYLNHVWGENCIWFNDSVATAILARPSIRTVIMASAWGPLRPDARDLFVDGQSQSWTAEAGLNHLKVTVERLRRAGKHVILVGATPLFRGDPVECQRRQWAGLLTLSPCSSEPVPDLADHQLQQLGVVFLSPRVALCDRSACDVGAFRDHGHLNERGATKVTRELGLAGFVSSK